VGVFLLIFATLTLLGVIPLGLTIWKACKKENVSNGRWYLSVGIFLGIIAGEILLVGFLGIYGEVLWFDNLGQVARYWKVFWIKFDLWGITFIGTTIAAYLNFKSSGKKIGGIPYLSGGLAVLVGIIFSLWASELWQGWLLYKNQVPGNITDPIFGLNESFYLFTLPFYNSVYSWLAWLIFIMIVGSGIYLYIGTKKLSNYDRRNHYRYYDDENEQKKEKVESKDILIAGINSLIRQILFWIAILCFLFIWGKHLDKFGLMYSTEGVVKGIGYTDFHTRLPIYTIMMYIWGFTGLFILAITFVKSFYTWLITSWKKPIIIVFNWLFVVAILLIGIPSYVYYAKVKPSEKTIESEFIVHTQSMTRYAFGLEKENIREVEFPVSPELTRETIANNKATLDNVRLWDPRALHSILTQTQEIRLYYEFAGVDVDRYLINGTPRQVMVSARELALDQLPKQAKTWINQHFKYTHGHGITVNPVNTFLYNGSPEFWVKDIPAVSTVSELDITRPEIYFGELTNHHIYVNTKEKEFDYPIGDQNEWTIYEGGGGIKLSGFLRKLAFAWAFDGHKIFFSDYLTPESKIIFRRNIQDRMKALAPFLCYDPDPYPVIYNGGITWIQDTYTVSEKYPYSETYANIKYIRNAVKATVNAYDGTVIFYIFDDTDPIIKAYQKAFPTLFKPASDMPAELREHIRYPEAMFKIQHEAFRKYHIDGIENFYNQEDMWDLATELYRGQPIPVEPYFVTAQLLGANTPEFMLMNPYTAKGKPRMTGWMSGLCDGDSYGKLVLYKFPKGEFIAGPQQIESKIDSNEDISKELSLWDQRGSEVIRGNLIILPLIGNALIGFEPVYLQSESTKIPTLTRVVAAQILPGDQKVVWDKTYSDVLNVLLRFKGSLMGPGARNELKKVLTSDELVDRALQSLVQYQELSGAGKYKEAGEVLENLHALLKNKQ